VGRRPAPCSASRGALADPARGTLAAHEAAANVIAALDRTRPDDLQSPAWLARAEAWLKARVEQGDGVVRVRDAAGIAGVHPVHLARVFRAHHHARSWRG
jgi:hypothetical protein